MVAIEIIYHCMRTFVAIELPEQIKSELGNWQKKLKEAARGARWVRPEGVHLTLKFLGKIFPEQIESVKQSLARLPRFVPFTAKVEGFGFFPNSQRPRTFWAGVEVGPGLSTLAAEVERSLESVGFAREQRPFKPHLTLARFSSPQPQIHLQRELSRHADAGIGTITVENVYLFESKLSSHGTEYLKIACFPNEH